ncbi:MAG: AzlD domain-containing protein [Acidimicrobiales bacterium]
MNPAYQVLLAGVGTFFIRSSALVILGDRAIPDRVQQTLRLIAPAVLSAIAANSLLLDSGDIRPLGSWHLAALVAVGVSLKTKSLGWTLAAGLVALWAIQAIF